MNPMEIEALANTAHILTLSAQMEEFLRVLHIIGISMGLGGSLFADYLSFDMLMLPDRNGVTEARTVTRIHWFIFAGLGLIWLSGIGIALNKFSLDTIPNKLVVKIIVVTALSINAVMIGRFLVPISKKYQSPILRFMSKEEIRISAVIICISITCWFSALFVSKIVALQQMSILLVLFVIGGSYLVLFLVVRGFLNYAKSVLLSNSEITVVEEREITPVLDGSCSSSVAASFHRRERSGLATPARDFPAQDRSVERSGVLRQKSTAEPSASDLFHSSHSIANAHHSKGPSPKVGAFARGMSFQYSLYFHQSAIEVGPLNFSQAFPNPQKKFPWFDALEVTNQMSQVFKTNVVTRRSGSFRREPVTSEAITSRNNLAKKASDNTVRSEARSTISNHMNRTRRHILTDTLSPPSESDQGYSSRRSSAHPSDLRGRVPLVTQPAL